MVKPLFKWTGGKGRLLQKYTDRQFFPENNEFDCFVDLFFGAGAVTCWVADRYPDKPIIINDLNTELMLVYTQIRNNWAEFREEYVRTYERFLSTPEDKRKSLYNAYKKDYCWAYEALTDVELAASLLVMLKTNFNGIWQGYIMYGRRYSTPPGHINYKPTLFDISKVEQFRDVLRRCELNNLSFEEVNIPDRSWVFADPPYRDTKKMYSDQFTDELQTQLANHVQTKAHLYAESNKETGDGFWQSHFPENNIHYLDHKYTCGHGGSVNPVTEVLIKNYGHEEKKNPLSALF
jgi:DNA adenine methylase Dam